jgi:hypothetical protein
MVASGRKERLETIDLDKLLKRPAECLLVAAERAADRVVETGDVAVGFYVGASERVEGNWSILGFRTTDCAEASRSINPFVVEKQRVQPL